MARILLLTPQLPYPPHQGTSLRNLNIIRGLSDRHRLTLVSYPNAIDNEDQSTRKVLSQFCDPIVVVPVKSRSSSDRFIDLITKSAPDMALRLQSDEIARSIASLVVECEEKEAASFDIVQIEGIEMASVIPIVNEVTPGSKIVFDNHNAETELQRRAFEADIKNVSRWHLAAYSWIQTRRLRQYERWVCENSDHVVAVSTADKESILHIAPKTSVSVIPNCIDIAEYAQSESPGEHNFDLVFVGKMDYRPNVDAVLWFFDSIWPRIMSVRPETTWAIVGQDPHSRLDKLRDRRGITMTGKVETVHPYLSSDSISIMPLRFGSGTRLKLIQAMASGMAVVSTKIGAEGFDLVDQRELIIANDEGDFSAAILRLLSDTDLRLQLGQRAKSFAEHYDYRMVVPLFDKIYGDLLAI